MKIPTGCSENGKQLYGIFFAAPCTLYYLESVLTGSGTVSLLTPSIQ